MKMIRYLPIPQIRAIPDLCENEMPYDSYLNPHSLFFGHDNLWLKLLSKDGGLPRNHWSHILFPILQELDARK